LTKENLLKFVLPILISITISLERF